MYHTEIKLENGGRLLIMRPIANPSEQQGLFIPTETTNQILQAISDGTLKDDHETFTAMTIRAKAIVEGKYKWTGDKDFDRLKEVLHNFYSFSYWDCQKCDPEFLFSMGRLYAIIQQLSDYLTYEVTNEEPFASETNVIYINTLKAEDPKDTIGISMYLYKNFATDCWVIDGDIDKETAMRFAKTFFEDKSFQMIKVWKLGKQLYWKKPNAYCYQQVWCAYADKENNNN